MEDLPAQVTSLITPDTSQVSIHFPASTIEKVLSLMKGYGTVPDATNALDRIKMLILDIGPEWLRIRDDVLDLSTFIVPSLTSLSLGHLVAFKTFSTPPPTLTFLHLYNWKGSSEALASLITENNFPMLEELVLDCCSDPTSITDSEATTSVHRGRSRIVRVVHKGIRKLTVVMDDPRASVAGLKFLVFPFLKYFRFITGDCPGHLRSIDFNVDSLIEELSPSLSKIEVLDFGGPRPRSVSLTHKLLSAIFSRISHTVRMLHVHDWWRLSDVAELVLPRIEMLVLTQPLSSRGASARRMAFGSDLVNRYNRTPACGRLAIVLPSLPTAEEVLEQLSLRLDQLYVLENILFAVSGPDTTAHRDHLDLIREW